MHENDNVVPLSSKSLIEHVKEERERLVDQIVQSEKSNRTFARAYRPHRPDAGSRRKGLGQLSWRSLMEN
jgi:hypothetical protein